MEKELVSRVSQSRAFSTLLEQRAGVSRRFRLKLADGGAVAVGRQHSEGPSRSTVGVSRVLFRNIIDLGNCFLGTMTAHFVALLDGKPSRFRHHRMIGSGSG
jgi:hypothetical protein